jgi:pimeloyl-ACP methyl ester carboxylesterase
MIQIPRLTRSLALVLGALGACSTAPAAPEVPPARLTPSVVDLGGRAVEIVEGGAGDATVVFESGFGNDWSPWRRVATAVVGSARVLAYSRPGYGRSEPSPEPRDAAHIVEDLRALLDARGYAPPYVLVGHSFGGTYMELFAKSHPEEVRALVLVEPRPRDFARACLESGLEGCTIPDDVVATPPDGPRSRSTRRSRWRPTRSPRRAASVRTRSAC